MPADACPRCDRMECASLGVVVGHPWQEPGGATCDGDPVDWRARALAAEAEVARLRAEVDAAEAAYVPAELAREQAERERDAALAALDRYGQHGPRCAVYDTVRLPGQKLWEGGERPACTCGLDEALGASGEMMAESATTVQRLRDENTRLQLDNADLHRRWQYAEDEANELEAEVQRLLTMSGRSDAEDLDLAVAAVRRVADQSPSWETFLAAVIAAIGRAGLDEDAARYAAHAAIDRYNRHEGIARAAGSSGGHSAGG